MSPADAATVAAVLTWADLRGIDGHGVVRLPRYLEFIERGDLDPKAQPEIESETPATFLLNARRAAGAVAMKKAVAKACERAEVAGACFGLVRSTTHVGAIGRYAHEAVEKGFAVLMAAAGPPLMAYHGARVPSLSTSPLAIGVPGAESRPVILDIATSTVSMGKINQARARGQSIPEGWALAEDGSPTTEPKPGVIPLPMGGPKGSGLSLMIELLASVMASTPILSARLGPEKEKRHLQNAFVIALKISAFRPVEGFRSDVEELVAILKKLPPGQGFDEILLPGERGGRVEAVRRQTGIPIPSATWEALAQTAVAENVQLPQLISSEG